MRKHRPNKASPEGHFYAISAIISVQFPYFYPKSWPASCSHRLHSHIYIRQMQMHDKFQCRHSHKHYVVSFPSIAPVYGYNFSPSLPFLIILGRLHFYFAKSQGKMDIKYAWPEGYFHAIGAIM